MRISAQAQAVGSRRDLGPTVPHFSAAHAAPIWRLTVAAPMELAVAPSPLPAWTRFGHDLLALGVAGLCVLSVAAPSRLVQGGLVVCLSICLLVTLLTSGSRIRAADVFMLLWTGLAALSWLAWTIAPDATGIAVRTQAGVCALFILIRSTADRPKVLVAAAVGYLVGCVLAVLEIWRQGGLRLSFGFGSDRVSLMDLDQNYLAYSLVISLVLVTLLWRLTKSAARRCGLVAFGILAILGANQAGTRGAFVGLAAFVVWSIGCRFAPRSAFQLLVSASAALSVTSLTGWFDGLLRDQNQASARERGDLNGRLVIWPIARHIFQDHPWIGIGAGAFRDANPLRIVAHNGPLEVATGLGVAGLVLFYGTLYFALVTDTRSVDQRARALYVGGLLSMLTPIVLSGHWYQAPAMWVAIAIASRLSILTGSSGPDPAPAMRPNEVPAPHRLPTSDQRSTYMSNTASNP
jgi:O-antigen ligase